MLWSVFGYGNIRLTCKMVERLCKCGKPSRHDLPSGECGTCYHRRWRLNNQLKDTFNNLRNRARRDGIPFDLTIVEWEIWCGLTGYLELRGQGKNDLTVDRINTDPRRGYWGYRYGNMQALTASDNGRKSQRERRNRPWKHVRPKNSDDPF